VVVFTSALPSRLFFTPWTLLNKFIETASISDNPLPANPSAAAHLEDLAKSLGRGATQPLQPAPALAQTVSGRRFEFASNSMRLRSLTLHFPTGSPEATIEFVVGPMGGSLPVGLDGTFRVADLFGQRWACRGHWENGETFTVEQEAPSKVLRRRITFSFQGDTMSFEVNDRITGSVENFSAKMAETESSAR